MDNIGLLQAVTPCPVQMCQFHLLLIGRRLLTNKPHSSAGIELLALMKNMFSIGKEEFIAGFDNGVMNGKNSSMNERC